MVMPTTYPDWRGTTPPLALLGAVARAASVTPAKYAAFCAKRRERLGMSPPEGGAPDHPEKERLRTSNCLMEGWVGSRSPSRGPPLPGPVGPSVRSREGWERSRLRGRLTGRLAVVAGDGEAHVFRARVELARAHARARSCSRIRASGPPCDCPPPVRWLIVAEPCRRPTHAHARVAPLWH